MSRPISLSLAPEAKARIEWLVADFKACFQQDAIPAIMWISNELNPMLDSQPAIGFYTNRDDIADEILVIDGIELVLAVADSDLVYFDGKALDYDNTRFRLN